MEDEPLIPAAMNLAIAIPRFANNAPYRTMFALIWLIDMADARSVSHAGHHGSA
jgi:hypothetical protein